MSRTDLDPATLAKALRRMTGDGSVDWVMEPMQASVLLDMADMLDNNAKLHQQLADVTESMGRVEERCAKLRELADGWDFCSKTKSPTFDSCVGCPLFIQTPHGYWCARDERMRDLGIEV